MIEEKPIPTDGHIQISIPINATSMTSQFMRLIEELPWAGLSFIPDIPVDPDNLEDILKNYKAYEARVADIKHVHGVFNMAFQRATEVAAEARDHYLDELRERIIGIGFEARLPTHQYDQGYKQMAADAATERRREADDEA